MEIIVFHFFQLERLIHLRDFCGTIANHPKIKQNLLIQSEWSDIVKIMTTLAPFKKNMLKLQSEQCTLSDFYGFWTLIHLKLGKENSPLTESLINDMMSYHEMLVNNPTVIAAVYLDPRYQRSLSNEKKEMAISFLKALYQKIRTIENIQSNDNTNNEQASRGADDDDSYDEMEAYLNSIQPESTNNTQGTPADGIDIEKLLKDFDGQKESLKSSVLQFWEENKSIHPILYKLSSAVFTIPPTQSSVERGFSSFAIVLTARRTRLGDAILEKILLIKTNKDLLNCVDISLNE